MAGRLRGNGLSYLEAMGISVAIMAPTAAMALNGSLAASIAGTSVPLTFLVALITIAFVAFAFIQFNRSFATSGSVYVFTGAALGARTGFLSGWTLLLTYLAFTGANLAEIGAFLQSFLAFLNIQISWVPIAGICGLLLFVLSLLEVRVSARTMLIFEVISMVLILILAVVILGHAGSQQRLSGTPFVLGANKPSAIGLAAVFAFLSFAGFEGSSTLGAETRNPRRAIPLAIGSAVVITGAFYVLVSYAQSIGFGLDQHGVQAFASSMAPLGDLAQRYLSRGFAAAIMFGAALSAFSSGLGTVTAGSRLLFSMGQDGFIHRGLGRVNRRFGTPHVSLIVVVAIGMVVVLALSASPGTSVFGWLGSVGVLALLLAYLVTNIGGIVYFVRQRVWRGPVLIIPTVAIIMLGYTLYSNVYPFPSGVALIFPYIVIVWIAVGAVIIRLDPRLVANFARRITAAPATDEAEEVS